MATLTPFTKSNAAVPAPQSPPPPGWNTGDQTWVQPPVPTAHTTGGTGYPFPSQPAVVGNPPSPTPAGAQAQAVTAPTRGTGGVLPGQNVNPPKPYLTSTQGNTQDGVYAPVLDEGSLLQNYLGQFLSADSALMRDARTRGIEAAAGAGLQNSSLAAGASQRAALDVAVPLAQSAFGMFGEREGREWTAEQNRLDRDQQITMSQVQNWLNNESFMREFNANLSLLPITNTTQLLNTIMQQAIDNPQVYTPDVVSGLSEFFTTNFLDVLSRYFPSMYAQTGGA